MSSDSPAKTSASEVTFASPLVEPETGSGRVHYSQRASTLDELRDVKENMIQLFMATIDMAKGMTQNDEGKWVYTPDSDEDLARMPQNLAVILDDHGPIHKMTKSLGDRGKLGSALLSYDGLNESQAGHVGQVDMLDGVIVQNDIELSGLKEQLCAMTKEKSVMEADKVNTAIRHKETVTDLMTKMKQLNSQVISLQQDNATLTTVQSQSAKARDESIAVVLAEFAGKATADKEAAEMAAAFQASIDKEAAEMAAAFQASIDMQMAEDAKFAAAVQAETAKKAVVATTPKADAVTVLTAKKDKYAQFADLFDSMVVQAKVDQKSAGPGQYVIDQVLTSKEVRVVFDQTTGVTTKETALDAGVLHGDNVGDTKSLTLLTRFGDGEAPERDERAYQGRINVGAENLTNTFLSAGAHSLRDYQDY